MFDRSLENIALTLKTTMDSTRAVTLAAPQNARWNLDILVGLLAHATTILSELRSTASPNLILCLTQPANNAVFTEGELRHQCQSFDVEVPQNSYFIDAELEHPSILGLMLTKPQRMYKAKLEFVRNGEITHEDYFEQKSRFFGQLYELEESAKKYSSPRQAPLPPEQEAETITPEVPTTKLVCVTVPSKEDLHPSTAKIFNENPQRFFSDAMLEHPAIKGLMLNRDQRMYKNRLQYSEEGGKLIMEMSGQAYNRIAWKAPLPPTPARADKV